MLRKIPGLSGLGAATLVAVATVGLGCQGGGSFARLQESLSEIRDNQQTILARLDQLDEKVGTAPQAPARPDQRKARPGQPDPAKTYKVPLGDAHTKGPADAKVTIVEWSDYQ
jgi:protein-disulfide isomerase